MPDQRSRLERVMWDTVGPPLYYCADCLRGVSVTAVAGAAPHVVRPCGPECRPEIIAPRRAVCVGKGGASMRTKAQIGWMKLAALLTGRSVG
jgi:hypothetical protein